MLPTWSRMKPDILVGCTFVISKRTMIFSSNVLSCLNYFVDGSDVQSGKKEFETIFSFSRRKKKKSDILTVAPQKKQQHTHKKKNNNPIITTTTNKQNKNNNEKQKQNKTKQNRMTNHSISMSKCNHATSQLDSEQTPLSNKQTDRQIEQRPPP